MNHMGADIPISSKQELDTAALLLLSRLSPDDVISEEWRCSYPGYHWFAFRTRRDMLSIHIYVNSFSSTLLDQRVVVRATRLSGGDEKASKSRSLWQFWMGCCIYCIGALYAYKTSFHSKQSSYNKKINWLANNNQ